LITSVWQRRITCRFKDAFTQQKTIYYTGIQNFTESNSPPTNAQMMNHLEQYHSTYQYSTKKHCTCLRQKDDVVVRKTIQCQQHTATSKSHLQTHNLISQK